MKLLHTTASFVAEKGAVLSWQVRQVQGTQVHLQTQADEVHEGYEAAGHVEIKTVLGKPREP